MAGRAHEEKHGEGQPEGGARGEIVPTHQPLGFRRIYNVAGGTGAWVAAGYPVEKPSAAI